MPFKTEVLSKHNSRHATALFVA